MSLGELLRTKSSEQRSSRRSGTPSGPRSTTTTSSPARRLAVVGIVLREVAEAIELGWGEEADAH